MTLRRPDAGTVLGAAGLVALAALGAALLAVRPVPEAEGALAPVRAVTTLLPLEMLVRELGADRVAVVSLVPPGASPHVFDPRPRDLARVARADLLVRAGDGLDDWAERLRGAAPPGLSVFSLAEAVPDPAHAHPDATPRAHADPHRWLDPLWVRDALAPALAARLAALDPAGAPRYRERLAAFRAELDALHAELRRTLETAAGRRYVAFHGAWGRFARRYDLQEVGVVEEAAGEEPTPRELARLVAGARRAGIRAILVEPQLPPRVAEVLAAEFGGGVVQVDPLGDPRDPERARYAALLRGNARAFARALGSAGPEETGTAPTEGRSP